MTMEMDNMIERDAAEVPSAAVTESASGAGPATTVGTTLDRLSAAATELERTLARLEERQAAILDQVHSAHVHPAHVHPAPADSPQAHPGEVHHVVAVVETTAGALEASGEEAASEAHYASVDRPAFDSPRPTSRETELERRLEAAENQIASLRAESARAQLPEARTGQAETRSGPARKTQPSIAATLLAKHGLHGIESVEAGALDAALAGLSLEQRIAVKSQLLRAGALV
ncbi:MAG TPA: hypothetical protein VGD59_13535 [Acidisarcina sp.]